jgi:NAD(P)-dependent dehydrogenase (short-subunit alcohol dehydrogenase family)
MLPVAWHFHHPRSWLRRIAMEFSDSTVVVTGAARGIGKAIAREFGERGSRVVLADISAGELKGTAEEFARKGYRTLACVTDTTDVESVEQLGKDVLRRFGSIDILVNNAGTFSSIAPVWEADPERWLRDIRVNLYGSFLMCRRFVGDLVKKKAGYVINIVSSGGVSDPHAYMTSYASSKTALLRLTEGLAKEVEPFNVKVFAIGPPAILTDMTRFIVEDPGGRKWRPEFAQLFEHGEDYPPELVSELIIELVSGHADELTGRYIPATEKLSRLVSRTEEIRTDDLLTLRIMTSSNRQTR